MSIYEKSPITIMFRSGAKGGIRQIGQLGGIRGELRSMDDRLLPVVKHNFREGVTPLEFCSGSQAGRKTMCEKKLSTAPAGAFTRDMIEAAYRVVIATEDCGTSDGMEVRDYSPIEPLLSQIKDGARIKGCMTLEKRREGREPLPDGRFRSVLTCKVKPPAVCARCYGRELSTGDYPPKGLPVGIIAGQSIGERGTQLTLRTFHTGGAKGDAIVEGLSRTNRLVNNADAPVSLFEVTDPGQTEIGRYWQQDFGNSRMVVDAWVLFLHCFYGLQKDNYGFPSISPLGKYRHMRLSDLGYLDYIRDILLLEGHMIYEGAVHERHFEVILRAILSAKEEYPRPSADRFPFLDALVVPDLSLDLGQLELTWVGDLLTYNKRRTTGLTPVLSDNDVRVLKGEYDPMVMGLQRAAQNQPSFLASASYRRALEVLAKGALEHAEDPLEGIKERLITGKSGGEEY